MTRDSGDLDSACAEVNEDEHVLPHSAQHRPGVDGQEVGREMGGFESAAGAASSGEDGEHATRAIVYAANRRRWLCPTVVAGRIQRSAVGTFAGRRRDPAGTSSHSGATDSRAEDPVRGRQAQHRDSRVAMRRAGSRASRPGATATRTPDVSFTSKVVDTAGVETSRSEVTSMKPGCVLNRMR
ncbi:MAG: hypothetical protein IPK13_00010 [Deltaproteobacteria bacterium]|nr:hypothetical protein [Deltaproteobacteria bacterium]